MKINYLLLTLVVVVVDFCHTTSEAQLEQSQSFSVVHSRKRRYVVFPEGSTLTMAFCISPTALTGLGGIFTSGVAWALSYDLPNETVHHTKPSPYDFPVKTHRSKRDLFVRVEKLINTSGFDGKSCVLKAICETAQQVIPRQGVLEEIFRLIFTYSTEEKLGVKDGWSKSYRNAQEAGESNENCQDLFPCPISLLQLGLNFGKY